MIVSAASGCCQSEGWTIVVVRKRNLFGRDQDVESLLRQGYAGTRSVP